MESQPVNFLQQIISAAYINQLLLDSNRDNEYSIDDVIIPIPKQSEHLAFERKNGQILYDNKEMAGVAGLFLKLKEDNQMKIVYSNDLGSSITGIDCVAKKGDDYYICEAKGTTSNKPYLSRFLKHTKTKGRQMSWDWIWNTLVEFAQDVLNAPVFLELFENVIEQNNINRIVSISQLKKVNTKYTIHSTRFYNDNELKNLTGIETFSSQNELLAMLKTIR